MKRASAASAGTQGEKIFRREEKNLRGNPFRPAIKFLAHIGQGILYCHGTRFDEQNEIQYIHQEPVDITAAMEEQISFAIDFDGVIHKYSKGWQNGDIYDVPMEGSKETLAFLVQKGYRIIIFTTRLNHTLNTDFEKQREMLVAWLATHGFVQDVHYHEMTAIKPKAKVYVDDRALRFTDWQNVRDTLLGN